jgi:two-component system response regulator HydG
MPASDSRASVLVVDDRLEMAETLADGLRDQGYEVTAVASSQTALEKLENDRFDALITDLRMPHVDGLALLQASRRLAPNRPVIVMTAFGAIDSAVESIRLGAAHYLTKPFKLEELTVFLGRSLEDSRVRQEAAALRTTLKERFSPSGFIGESAPMRLVLDLMERLAESDTPVLITGETGTGKGVIARALHAQGPRASRPFVTVNCAALPEALLESELFGHVKGAFTGATMDRHGLFREAEGGTIFLDEIGEMPNSLQAKLLHVLESNVVRPVGSSREVQVNFRVIAATNQDLRERTRSGSFRSDLLYRLDVVPIVMPPLRQRREDVPLFVAHFLKTARDRHPSSPVRRISPGAVARLAQHRWPGNVRELAHLIERLVVLGREESIEAADLPEALFDASPSPEGLSLSGEVLPIREVQRRYARWALQQFEGHRGRTAERLGIDAKTLAKWLSEDGAAG